MTEILPKITQHIHQQDVSQLAAVVNRKNKGAVKVLERAQFRLKSQFDSCPRSVYFVTGGKP